MSISSYIFDSIYVGLFRVSRIIAYARNILELWIYEDFAMGGKFGEAYYASMQFKAHLVSYIIVRWRTISHEIDARKRCIRIFPAYTQSSKWDTLQWTFLIWRVRAWRFRSFDGSKRVVIDEMATIVSEIFLILIATSWQFFRQPIYSKHSS